MIKNWKLFLESINNDDEFDEHVSELKRNLKDNIQPLIKSEKMMRMLNDTNSLTSFADLVSKGLVNALGDSITSSDFPEEAKNIILNSFISSVNEIKETMINDSFEKGIDLVVDKLISIIKAIKEANDREGEEWRDEKPLNYEELTKSELNDLINQALDSKDYTRVKFLAQYLKESIDQHELENILKVIAELITKYLTEIYSKKYI